MANIVTKLNLNKTPSIVEANSLIFAKNIRLDVDGSIHKDYGILPISVNKGKFSDYLVDYGNILKRIISDVHYRMTEYPAYDDYLDYAFLSLKKISGDTIKDADNRVIASNGKFQIVGTIAGNNEFYLFIHGIYLEGKDEEQDRTISYDCIIRYDEKTDSFLPCNCNWHWSNGTIDGCIITNLRGEKILNICEYDTNKLVPFKSINLNKSYITDNESVYTQTPEIPITNIFHVDDFNYSIPNGVYQFFIRYKIRDNFYTNWFPASKEFFAGNKNKTFTTFGAVEYVNTHKDSDCSFVFSIEHLFANKQVNYESFQLGFILSHDDTIVARAWKHFKFDTQYINFDYNANDSEEIEVSDLIDVGYQIYNVGNITTFKNKLYISNYKETNFNENYQDLANEIKIHIKSKNLLSGFDTTDLLTTIVNGKSVVSGRKINNTDKPFSGVNGIINDILTKKNDNNYSIKDDIKDAITRNTHSNLGNNINDNSVIIKETITSLEEAKVNFKKEHDLTEEDNDIRFGKIKSIEIDDTEYESLPINVESLSEIELNKVVDKIIEYIYNTNLYLTNTYVFIDDKGTIHNNIVIKINRTVNYNKKIYTSNGGNTSPDVIINGDTSSNGTISRPENKPDVSTKEEIIPVETIYTQTIILTVDVDRTQYNLENQDAITKYSTLIPYQKYKFYIHYINKNGEITNGYYCNGVEGGIKEAPFMQFVDSVIYPEFSNIHLPTNYVACFFSILHYDTNSYTVFDIENKNGIKIGSCMDINIGSIPGTNSMTIKQEDTTDNGAKYFYSSDSTSADYFGANGVIQFSKDSAIEEGNGVDERKVAYVINDYTASNSDNIQLIKCTPFINPKLLKDGIYSEFDKMNLLGFICNIEPLNRNRTINYYTDGATVFKKDGRLPAPTPNIPNSDKFNGETLKLTEIKTHLGDIENNEDLDLAITKLDLLTSNAFYIYSNNNLNYLSLLEEPTEVHKSYYWSKSGDTKSNGDADGSVILRLFKSLIMNSVYTFPSMYKNYTRKIYLEYTKDNIFEFNNTIRSSILNGDESTINIFKFDVNDYYNVPTDKGKIVNLVTVGNGMLIHTEDTMFKFSGSNSLQSSEGEVQQRESDIFNTGITEIFGAEFGFAGIQNKKDCAITEQGYFFFDRDSRTIYFYSGQGQIVRLSDSVEKLFKHRPIESISFANDFYNNRIFVSILFYDGYPYKEGENPSTQIKKTYFPITLSFNINENIKSFVSLHDFYYHYAFNTKTKCYFLTSDNKDICKIITEDSFNYNNLKITKDDSIITDIVNLFKGCYTKLELYKDKLYPYEFDNISVPIVTADTNSTSVLIKLYNLKSFYSIVDVINNSNYEVVKTLNSISWCGNKIKNKFNNIINNDNYTWNLAEDVNYDIPCKYIQIYSDTCFSDKRNCTRKANDSSISKLKSIEYPYYNQGVWNFNYFRNILNDKNSWQQSLGSYISDNNSLIEGKYFVVRFTFDEDFKLETIIFNFNTK